MRDLFMTPNGLAELSAEASRLISPSNEHDSYDVLNDMLRPLENKARITIWVTTAAFVVSLFLIGVSLIVLMSCPQRDAQSFAQLLSAVLCLPLLGSIAYLKRSAIGSSAHYAERWNDFDSRLSNLLEDLASGKRRAFIVGISEVVDASLPVTDSGYALEKQLSPTTFKRAWAPLLLSPNPKVRSLFLTGKFGSVLGKIYVSKQMVPTNKPYEMRGFTDYEKEHSESCEAASASGKHWMSLIWKDNFLKWQDAVISIGAWDEENAKIMRKVLNYFYELFNEDPYIPVTNAIKKFLKDPASRVRTHWS
ncbi:hypothetical protein [Sphingomonas sanguinis]|uniref:hypothetical protein n=1 Tax=Sphingomonas sanguinis TaxID=33051 RepID=UPI003018F596